MSSSLLEHSRLLHEDIELKQQQLVTLLETMPSSHKDAVILDHKVQRIVEIASQEATELLQIYKDDNGLRRNELAAITTQTIFTGFYERLRAIREYHTKFPDTAATIFKNSDLVLEPKLGFSGDEMNGKYLDMHLLHERCVNMEQFSKMNYYTYVSTFHLFQDIPKSKKNSQFKSYLNELVGYLASFHSRIRPLYNVPQMLERLEKDFENRWSTGSLPGWDDSCDSNEVNSSNPLYCKACAKLFTNTAVYESHLIGKKHVKNAELLLTAVPITDQNKDLSMPLSVANASGLQTTLWKEIAREEYKRHLLGDFVTGTLSFIEKKQTKSWEEIEAELNAVEEEAYYEVEDDNDDENKPIYNPLNIPLGWDGKPIPYWLYKLHGLNIEYKCQICGDYSYWGPRAYQRHFQEPRHAQGMRALGIPNSSAFVNITSIDKAKLLWEKLHAKNLAENFIPELQEEVEDNKGNVYTRKDYEELRRHRLI